MKLLEFSPITDHDLEEIMSREIPCETSEINDGKRWIENCTDNATWWMNAMCRQCGQGQRILVCQPCAAYLRRWVKLLTLPVALHKNMLHGKCRRPVFLKFTYGTL